VGHTTLSRGERAEYFHDADVLVALHLMIHKARSDPHRARQHPELILGWEHALDTTGPGFVDLKLGKLGEADRKYIVELMTVIQADLNTLDEVPSRLLTDWRVPDLSMDTPYSAARVREALGKLIWLLSA
jgi:hypothetical protein